MKRQGPARRLEHAPRDHAPLPARQVVDHHPGERAERDAPPEQERDEPGADRTARGLLVKPNAHSPRPTTPTIGREALDARPRRRHGVGESVIASVLSVRRRGVGRSSSAGVQLAALVRRHVGHAGPLAVLQRADVGRDRPPILRRRPACGSPASRRSRWSSRRSSSRPAASRILSSWNDGGGLRPRCTIIPLPSAVRPWQGEQ